MEASRIGGDETSRISLFVGLGVALVGIGIALYFVFIGHSALSDIIGFDPNRPIPSDDLLKKRLKPEQYHVVRENGTETPFKNDFWENKRPGIYVDIIDGEPLFTSLDKVDSTTGLPSFSKPISYDALVEKLDTSHDMQRTEVRAKRSDAHLGHVFGDPTLPTGRRYSLNSAAFRFIPVERLEKEGYGQYLPLFGMK
jgi:peptide methionine sulfoxide reductase msrA/msrB